MPNPFNARTDIIVALPKAGAVTVEMFDITGRNVSRISGEFAAGIVHISWDGKTTAGRELSSGLYLARVRFGDETKIARAMLIK